MSLRRYAPIAPSKGTVIPAELRQSVIERDGGCPGAWLFSTPCAGPIELDHVRASHGMGMKSETTEENLVALCGRHHRFKTENGRAVRPVLLSYLAQIYGDCTHVEPVHGCQSCVARASA